MAAGQEEASQGGSVVGNAGPCLAGGTDEVALSSRLLGYLSQNSGPREGIQAGPGPWGDLHKSVGPWTSMPSSLRWVCPGTTLWSADHVSGKGLTWRQGRQRSLRSWGTARGFPERGRARGREEPPGCQRRRGGETNAGRLWEQRGAVCKGALHARSSFRSDQEATGVETGFGPNRRGSLDHSGRFFLSFCFIGPRWHFPDLLQCAEIG